MRSAVSWMALVAWAGCGGDSGVTVSGDAFDFLGPMIRNAKISVLEDPSRTTTSGASGHFVFDDIPVGSELTLVLDHPDYMPIQTGTHLIDEGGLDRITFQAVSPAIYGLLADGLGATPDPERCQLVTTVTRVGKSIYDAEAHGEAGATVTLDPPLPLEQGPIYFNASVRPDRTLTETSADGGVLYLNVPPGEYTWTAHKDGVSFTQLEMICRAGVLVNASPPRGLQAL